MDEKVSKSEAQYTDNGSDTEYCAICEYYQGRGVCARVRGQVVRGGWCKFFEERS